MMHVKISYNMVYIGTDFTYVVIRHKLDIILYGQQEYKKSVILCQTSFIDYDNQLFFNRLLGAEVYELTRHIKYIKYSLPFKRYSIHRCEIA